MTFSGCCPTKFILKGTPEELESFAAKKLLLIAANCTNIPIVCETATPEECKELSSLTGSLVLLIIFQNPESETVAVATSRAMMKTIASFGGNIELSVIDEAMVDGWLSFVWKSIDLPLQAAWLLLHDERISEEEKEGIEEDLKNALTKIEAHLSKQASGLSEKNLPLSIVPATRSGSTDTFYSLADLSLAVTIHFLLEEKIAVSAMNGEENPYLYRWTENIHVKLGLVPDVS